MKLVAIRTVIVSMMLVAVFRNSAVAEIMTFNVNVVQTSITLGQSVNWEIYATVSNSTTSNLGIATIALDLVGDVGAAPTVGTISPLFSDYTDVLGGTALGNTLFDIHAFQFSYNAAVVEAADGTSLGPLLFASGSFTPTTLGTHTLTATGVGYTNEFFSSPLPTTTYSSVNPGTDTFTVTTASVPEPSSVLLLTAATGIAGAWRVRSRKKSQCCV